MQSNAVSTLSLQTHSQPPLRDRSATPASIFTGFKRSRPGRGSGLCDRHGPWRPTPLQNSEPWPILMVYPTDGSLKPAPHNICLCGGEGKRGRAYVAGVRTSVASRRWPVKIRKRPPSRRSRGPNHHRSGLERAFPSCYHPIVRRLLLTLVSYTGWRDRNIPQCLQSV